VTVELIVFLCPWKMADVTLSEKKTGRLPEFG
jgi:hypothetical protein